MKRTFLKQQRLNRNLTQKDVAEQVSLTKSAICDIETGRRNPSIQVANALEDLFGIPQRALLQIDYTTNDASETKGS